MEEVFINEFQRSPPPMDGARGPGRADTREGVESSLAGGSVGKAQKFSGFFHRSSTIMHNKVENEFCGKF